MVISSILRHISYSFNTNFLLVNFVFVKKNTKKGGGGGAQVPLDPPLGSGEMLLWGILKF